MTKSIRDLLDSCITDPSDGAVWALEAALQADLPTLRLLEIIADVRGGQICTALMNVQFAMNDALVSEVKLGVYSHRETIAAEEQKLASSIELAVANLHEAARSIGQLADRTETTDTETQGADLKSDTKLPRDRFLVHSIAHVRARCWLLGIDPVI